MTKISFLTAMTLAVLTASVNAQPADQGAPANPSSQEALVRTITDLDTDFFGTFNSCDTPDQLQRHANLLDPKLEFYHDNGGVTWTRKDYIDKTRQNACGNFTRKLVAGSMQVYPIKGFGAIEEGEQIFCEVKTGKCVGAAKFMLVWHQTPDGWHVTRAFSYGHHEIK